LFNEQDEIISDALNHASLIDGMRLSKAKKIRYEHNDMQDLENILKVKAGQRTRVIVTDGVFSMDGMIAQLDKICDLAKKYGALVMVDDSHATGFIGKTGRGTHEYHNVMGRVDIITGTLGKALGGANGGFIAGKKSVIKMLRQRSRPYLFSNSLAPSIVGASIAVLDMLKDSTKLRDRLHSNTKYFRTRMTEAGFDTKVGEHPIVPVMLYDAVLAQTFAARLLDEGIYVTGFFYPVVPQGQARIRVQLSAAHEPDDLDRCIAAFIKIGVALNKIPRENLVLIKKTYR
jgi:glycine C-acetyltransferase